jgi:hypothetical protein
MRWTLCRSRRPPDEPTASTSATPAMSASMSRRCRSSHCLPGRLPSPCRCHTSCVMRPRRRSTNETKWEPSRSGHEGSASGLKDREWIEFACRCAAQERPPRFESRPWQGRNNAVAVRLAARPGHWAHPSFSGSKRRPKPPRIRAISAARRGRCANAHERYSAYTYTGTKVPCQGVNSAPHEGPNGTVAKTTPNGGGETARAARGPREARRQPAVHARCAADAANRPGS